MLTLDDGLTPDGDLVGSFAVEPGGTSVVALRNPDGSESLREYQSATGAYGPVLATDTSPANAYQVLGVDQGAHRAAVLHSAATGSSLETYDTATGQQVNAAPAPGYTVVGGRVDAVRHRAAVLAHRTADNADVLLPLSLSTGTLGSEIPIDGPGAKPGSYLMIEVDQATGEVYASRGRTQAVCFGGGIGAVAKVNLDSGAIVPAPSATVCGLGLGVDDSAGKIYQLSYQSFSVNILGNSVLSPLSGDTLESGDSITVRQQSALGLAVDAVHHLALVAFQSPPVIPLFGTSLLFDNNAMSQLAVVDLTSGKTVSVVSGLNYRAGFFGGEFNKSSQRSIQLDPAGRTGWTYSPDGLQIQQFRY
jgi:hypothetical protein